MILARAAAGDLDQIAGLEREGFHEDAWSVAAWRAELEAADRLVLVARDLAGGAVLGVATFQGVLDTADLHRVVVRADSRGRDIGRSLVLAGFEWAEAAGAERMLLEVAEDNEAALALYRRTGFEPIARRRDYYGQGRHALVLERELGTPAWTREAAGERSVG